MHNGIKALTGLGCLRSKLQSTLFQLRTVGIKRLETHEHNSALNVKSVREQ